MQELLNHPAAQAALFPFLAALVLAALLRTTRQMGLAILAGFLCAAWLTVGFEFESLTSVKKLLLVAAGAGVLGIVFELTAPRPRTLHRIVAAAVIALAAAWVLQRILAQAELARAALTAFAVAAFCIAMLSGADRASRDPVAAASAALMSGLAAGALALLGASAQLAQLGIATGAGAGAVLLVLMISGARAAGGWTVGLAAQVIAALVAVLAVMTGALPWYCVLPLPLVGWFASLPSASSRPAWQRAFLCSLAALVPAAAAVALAWFTAASAGG